MSLLFLILKATHSTNWDYDIPIFFVLFQLDCLIVLQAIRTVWTLRRWS